MKQLVLIMIIMVSLSNVTFSNSITDLTDNATKKVNDSVDKAVDQQTDKMINKANEFIDKAGTWLFVKTKSLIWSLTEIISVIGIGWLLSFLCDRDSRTMIRFLIVLIVISILTEKLVSS